MRFRPPSHRRVIGRASGSVTFAGVDVPAAHNRWRVWSSPASTITAGNVDVTLQYEDPDIPNTYLSGVVGTLAFGANGSCVDGDMAPGLRHRFGAVVTGWAGAGNIVIGIETWFEGED